MMPFHKAHQNFICQQRTKTNIKNHIENWVGGTGGWGSGWGKSVELGKLIWRVNKRFVYKNLLHTLWPERWRLRARHLKGPLPC